MKPADFLANPVELPLEPFRINFADFTGVADGLPFFRHGTDGVFRIHGMADFLGNHQIQRCLKLVGYYPSQDHSAPGQGIDNHILTLVMFQCCRQPATGIFSIFKIHTDSLLSTPLFHSISLKTMELHRQLSSFYPQVLG